MGAAGLNVAYDSLWLEVFVVSGIIGVVLAAARLVLLAARWVRVKASLDRAEWQLAGGVLVLAVGASLGIPSLTANRHRGAELACDHAATYRSGQSVMASGVR